MAQELNQSLPMLRQQLHLYSGSMAELAERTQMTPQSLGLYFNGKRKKQLHLIITKASDIITERQKRNEDALQALRNAVNNN